MSNICFPLSPARLMAAFLAVSGVLAVVFAPAHAQAPGAPASDAAASSANRNVYAAGGQVRPPAPVEGDFVAGGGRVIVDQPVKGDATLAGGSVDVRAPVSDDVRAVGGDVSIESSLGGELFVAAGNITLTKAATVGRGAKLYGGNVTVDGRIDGELKASAQRITINGEVRGDARLAGEQIELGPAASITGALIYSSGSEIKKADGATVGGSITRDDRTVARRDHRAEREWRGAVRGPAWAGSVFTFLALLACAAVFLLVFPMFAVHASNTVKTSPWLALAIGFGTLFAVPFLAALLFITLLGIPLGVAILALYPALLLAGYVVGVLFIARLIRTGMRKDAATSFAWSMSFFALALLLVMLLGRLPFIGGFAIAAITVAGIGACVIELHHRRQVARAARLGPGRPDTAPPASATGS